MKVFCVNKFKTVQEAVETLKEHDKSVEDFYKDPMTEAIGSLKGDFQRDFNMTERKILAFILKNAPKDSEEQEMALTRLEKWMP